MACRKKVLKNLYVSKYDKLNHTKFIARLMPNGKLAKLYFLANISTSRAILLQEKIAMKDK